MTETRPFQSPVTGAGLSNSGASEPFQSMGIERARGLTDEEKQMRTPAWKFELNLNSIITVVGFIGGFMAWGATWNDMQNKASANSMGIERLDKRLTAVEASMRVLDTQELRLKAVEKQAGDAAVSMRSLETTLNGLGSDIRVVREILQRIENGSRNHERSR